MPSIRPKSRFGRRFIRLNELRDYAVDLTLGIHPPDKGLMEFFEREGLLMPVRRVNLPGELFRRFTRDRYPDVDIVDPIEPDGPRLNAAVSLMQAVGRWSHARIFGESVHALAALDDAHRPFIQTEFSPGTFISSEDRRVRIYQTLCGPTLSNPDRDAPSYYHYWQIFWLAALLRSGAQIYFPLDDRHIGTEILRGNALSLDELRERSRTRVNMAAYQELRELREYEHHFETVGRFHAYADNALQTFLDDRDEHGRIPYRPWQRYLRREREVAEESFRGSGLSRDDLINFNGKQGEWWNSAHRIGPAAVAEEYKRNIDA